MNTHTHARRYCKLATIVLAALVSSSCFRAADGSLKLQANPVLSGGIGWAVVKDAYARLKQGPADSTPDVDHLRRGSVYRLDAREFGTDDSSAKPQAKNLWYGIESEGAKGWVRESELDIFQSRSQAEKAAAAYK